jgi:hypothetical protein
MIKHAKSSFQVVGGKISFTVDDFMRKLGEFALDFEGQWGEAYFEIIDSVQHFQHRYLYGYLLPDIAFALGETDIEYVKQFVLKPKFLFRELPDGDWKKIPSKYASKCRVIIDGKKVRGYIPSTSTLKFEEMDKFLKDCENFLTLDLNGCVGMAKENQTEAMQARGMANLKDMVGTRQESLFSEAV